MWPTLSFFLRPYRATVILPIVLALLFSIYSLHGHFFFEERILRQLPIRSVSMEAPPHDHLENDPKA